VRRVSVVITAVALLALAACGSSSKSEPAGSGATTTAPAKARPHVTIDAHEYGFKLPAQMPAGWVDVTLHNSGKVGHQIAFAKLGSTTLVAFKTAVSATDVKALKNVQFVGGPNNVEPGESVTATIHLEPGEYGVACFIPADDGKPHAAHGMIGTVKVVQTADSVEDAPKVDGGSIALSEFTFVPDASFTGTGTVEIKNVGTQLHELIIVKEAPGKTLAQVKAFFLTPPGTPPPAGPPPFTSAGGVVGVGPGQKVYQQMALTPGKYAFACFFPDPNKGDIPHALEGMFKEVTIS
jgi:plastocyanin